MSDYPLIDRVDKINGVKELNKDEIAPLCDEIRSFLVSKVTKNGGHLASNLGVVELTVALHRVFDLEKDRLIFDVGHQCYTHKILSGRREGFEALRQRGGMSGFTKRSESKYDPFGAGHSSTSVSAAIGFAEGERMKGSDSYTVAILGDGAFTGGMVHEALNNCRRDLKLIIVLNENEMSISKNTGAFASLIARIRASKGYYRTKRRTVKVIKRLPVIGNGLFRIIRKIKQSLKNKIFKSNYFEDLGLYYLGPVDGNDESKVERLLNEAKNASQSTVVHIHTVKGKGYEPAERDPSAFHGISPVGSVKEKNFSKMAGQILCDLADGDDRVCAVTAAMPTGTGLSEFEKCHPERFFDVGIAEEHALTFSAGLAADGYKPYFAVYSSFLQRGYDNLIHDIALQRLPVTVLVDRAGISESDGATHHGIFDISFLSGIPDMQIYTPSNFLSLEMAMKASLSSDTPVAIRYPNGPDQAVIYDRFKARGNFILSDFEDEGDYVIVTYGRIVSEAIKAADTLTAAGKKCGIILLEMLKPYSITAEKIKKLIPCTTKAVLFLEEGVKNGGAGMIFREKLDLDIPYIHLGIDDVFESNVVGCDVYSDFGIGCSDIISAFKDL